MIRRDHKLPLTQQAKLLGMSLGSVYYLPKTVSPEDLALMHTMDELHLEFPFAGSRMLRDLLNRKGHPVRNMSSNFIPHAHYDRSKW